MRHSLAHFHTLPARDVSAVERASRAPRRWFGTELDRVLGACALTTREFAGEGVMAVWAIRYLEERQAVETPERFFRTPLARTIRAGLEAQGRQTVRCVLTIEAGECEQLVPRMAAVRPSRSDLFAYERRKTIEALGLEAGERRVSEDESVAALVESRFTAFEWLLGCLRTVEAGTVGVLILRDRLRARRLVTRGGGAGAGV